MLLPHLPLLVRVIVPALRSEVGDLVNLGLRTLEFWVDNLNPLYLYPVLSENNILLDLMTALTDHLRPAPYPYGLLTLRLLGKLGGKNRLWIGEPMPDTNSRSVVSFPLSVECEWRGAENNESLEGTFALPLPLSDGEFFVHLRNTSTFCFSLCFVCEYSSFCYIGCILFM